MDQQMETAAPGERDGGGKRSASTSIIPPSADGENPPAELTRLPRWIPWRYIDGKKSPVDRDGRKMDGNDPANWATYEDVRSRAPEDGGIGFAFSGDDNLGGVDLDACRDPETGELTAWAQEIIDDFASYTEVSPSGTGVKIFARGAMAKLPAKVIPMPGEPIRGKAPHAEGFVSKGYFTVTGQRLPGPPAEVRHAPEAWLRLHKRLAEVVESGGGGSRPAAGRNECLYKVGCGMRAKGLPEAAIRAALEAANRVADPAMHPALRRDRSRVDRTGTIIRSVMTHAPGMADKEGFATYSKGVILANHQGNVRLAMARLGVAVSHNVFADRLLIVRDDEPARVLDDAAVDRLWLEVDETFRFRPTQGFFRTVVVDHARTNAFHPVRDYLDGLTWDGTARLDRWLVDYGGAADSDYCRAVGALVLVAAVRRARRPGVKFDELLVLESPRGPTSPPPSARYARTPAGLPMTSVGRRQQTGDRAHCRKWLVEAAELSGMRKGDVEHLKAFLSRTVDTARLAYGRTTTERPRHFIVVGTTNSDAYLKDATGNRRFWPLRVTGFDLGRLYSDRDQLWAEAAAREAAGVSIRLDPALWSHAEVQQERRRVEDPWESRLSDVLGDLTGKLLVEDAWRIVGMHDVARRTQNENARLGETMRRVGFERVKRRHESRNQWHYVRGTPEETERRIVLSLTRDDDGRVIDVEAGYAGDVPF